MIEFDGTLLGCADLAAAQTTVAITDLQEGAGLSTGLLSAGEAGDDTVLQDLSQTAGDDWVASLLADASSDAVAAGMLALTQLDLLDPQATEGEEEEQEIIITGTRTTSGRSYTWDGNGGTGATGGGHSGSGGGGGSAVPVEQHTQDCGTEDGAAVQVAKHVKGELPAGVSGPVDPVTTASGNDWTKVEFGAVIVRNADGTFGALNDMIYSSDRPGNAALPSGVGQPVQGIWHSHPGRGDAGQRAIDRYPSPDDWAALAQVGGQAGAVADPSIWIMGPDNITREFKLSESAYFKSLQEDPDRMKNGEGLEGRERTQSCG